MPLVYLSLNFIKIELMMTSFKVFSKQLIVNISNFIELANFILGTKIQQHKVHIMIKVKVTLTDSEGHRLRPKVTKN